MIGGKQEQNHSWIAHRVNPTFFRLWWLGRMWRTLFRLQQHSNGDLYWYYLYWYRLDAAYASACRMYIGLMALALFLYFYFFSLFSIAYIVGNRGTARDDPCIPNAIEKDDITFWFLNKLTFSKDFRPQESPSLVLLSEKDVSSGYKEIEIKQSRFAGNASVGFQLTMADFQQHVSLNKLDHLCVCFTDVGLPFQGGTFKENIFMNATFLRTSTDMQMFGYGNKTVRSPSYAEVSFLSLGSCVMLKEEIKGQPALLSCMVRCGTVF